MRDDHTSGTTVLRRFRTLRDYTIRARDGEVGRIDDMYFDDVSWTVRYLVVDTGSWLPTRQVLLPPSVLERADPGTRCVETTLDRADVEAGPRIDATRVVSWKDELALQEHYGFVPYWIGPHRWGSHPNPVRQHGDAPSRPHVCERPGSGEATGDAPYQDSWHLRSGRMAWRLTLRALDGHVGRIDDFLVDELDWAIRYLVVARRAGCPDERLVVGTDWIRGVSWCDRVVDVDVTRDETRHAPPYDGAPAFARDAEARLCASYGRPGHWERRPEIWAHAAPGT